MAADTREEILLAVEKIENTLLGITLDPRVPDNVQAVLRGLAKDAENLGKRLAKELKE